MTIKFTIIGLGQVGASIGLGLAEHKDKILRNGHDPEPTRAKKMAKEGAVDQIFFNLPESVREADVVILALPVGQIEDTLKYISEDLREGAVVIDTSPVHSGTIALARKYLLPGRHFISIYPVISPLYIDEYETDADKPHADLFDHSEFLVAAETTTHPDALQLVEDLATLLKAFIYISDPAEADGISARIELLPRLAAAASIHATIEQAGWNDNRRSAGKSFTGLTSAINQVAGDEHLEQEFLLNKENTLSAIDQLASSLQDIRQMIAESDEAALHKLLKQARDGRSAWMEQRISGDWEKGGGEKLPTTQSRINRIFVGKLFDRDYLGGQDKKK